MGLGRQMGLSLLCHPYSNPNPTLPFGTTIDVEATCFLDEFETKIQNTKKKNHKLELIRTTIRFSYGLNSTTKESNQNPSRNQNTKEKKNHK